MTLLRAVAPLPCTVLDIAMRPKGRSRPVYLVSIILGMTRAEQARYLAERSKPNRPAKSPRHGDAADTSRPGATATARKASAGAGEARNMKKNGSSKATFAPEASKGKPSRKSTRQSANRVKAASNLTRRQQRRVSSPAARAARGA